MGCELAGPSALSLRQQVEEKFSIAYNSETSGHINAATENYEQALHIAAKHFGKNNPALIQYTYFLGAAYEKAHRPFQAIPNLPETADEIRALSRSLKGNPYNILLGNRATESAVKDTDLSKYRIIAFATHGLLANEIGNPEAALVMSPPAKPNFYDDGLLTASEIKNLSLNANLVILSACNTATSETTLGTDGISSLSNAFFYAGARALLISHWRVDSAAAVQLTTNMIQYAVENPNAGYNIALKYSILKLMNDEKNAHFSHPTFWAPFVLVGGSNL